MRTAAFIVLVLVIAAGGFYFLRGGAAPTETQNAQQASSVEGASAVTAGSYTVDPQRSSFNWSARKPLIDGYINSGTVDVAEGRITVAEGEASGAFTLDMNTIHVGLTAKKPGQEGALEGHLKSERWFDVANHPTATFTITEVTETPESATNFTYTVHGNLTLKGQTHELSFPAKIYLEDGLLHAQAQTEIDRTLWGVTAGSENFFDGLAENAISDMVSLSFSIVATPAAAAEVN